LGGLASEEAQAAPAQAATKLRRVMEMALSRSGIL
jgi:hypothetical protein